MLGPKAKDTEVLSVGIECEKNLFPRLDCSLTEFSLSDAPGPVK